MNAGDKPGPECLQNMAYLTDLQIKGEKRDPAFCLTGTPVDADETALRAAWDEEELQKFILCTAIQFALHTAFTRYFISPSPQ